MEAVRVSGAMAEECPDVQALLLRGATAECSDVEAVLVSGNRRGLTGSRISELRGMFVVACEWRARRAHASNSTSLHKFGLAPRARRDLIEALLCTQLNTR